MGRVLWQILFQDYIGYQVIMECLLQIVQIQICSLTVGILVLGGIQKALYVNGLKHKTCK